MRGLNYFPVVNKGLQLGWVFGGAILVSGCLPAVLAGPERLFTVEQETHEVRVLNDGDLWRRYYSIRSVNERTAFRNDIITSRMYAIDLYYSNYEAALLRDIQEADFLSRLAVIGLDGTAAVINPGTTTKILAQIAGGVALADTAISEKLLRTQAIQNIQAAMRMARHEQAAIIFANMECSAVQYPLGMALSDVEIYRRAGTFGTGLMRLTQTVQKAEETARTDAQDQKPAGDKGVSKQKTAVAKASAEQTKAERMQAVQKKTIACAAVRHEDRLGT